ncbi:hypothetical protein ACVWWN_001728 [Mycobacterium sp. URHB0021]|jgi:hypothetical protein
MFARYVVHPVRPLNQIDQYRAGDSDDLVHQAGACQIRHGRVGILPQLVGDQG